VLAACLVATAAVDNSCNDPGECCDVTTYNARGTFEDHLHTFWSDLSGKLKTSHCSGIKYATQYGCSDYVNDTPYKVINDYIKALCGRGYEAAYYLKEIVEDYCCYHSEDRRVERSFLCSSGCKLADHLNQICSDIQNNAATGECPNGYSTSPGIGACFKFTEGGANINWHQAKQLCEMDGHALARIDNEVENNYVQELIVSSGQPSAWIGLSDLALGKAGGYTWAPTSLPVTYTNGDTSSSESQEYSCGQMNAEGEWVSSICETQACFVCRADLFNIAQP